MIFFILFGLGIVFLSWFEALHLKGGCLLFWIMIGLMFFVGFCPVSTKTEELQLAAISNSKGVSGDFFLGSGMMNNQEIIKFIYYPDPNDKTKKKISKVGVNDDVIIIEDNNVVPKLITTIYYKKLNSEYRREKYTFYIPENSIKEIYNIDISN